MNTFASLYPGGAASNVFVNFITNEESILVWFILVVITIVALWKIFQKAGQAGWKSIIPIYNAVILCRIANLSGWFAILLVVPLVNIVVTVILYIRMAKGFGQSGWFALGLILLSPIFILILAFDKPVFVGPYYGKNLAHGATDGDAEETPAAPAQSIPPSSTIVS